jgi:hypothetical protein
MNPPNHALKINWAKQHLDNLEREIGAWFTGNSHHSFRVERDPENPPNERLTVSADDIPATPFSLIIGDVVQNLRSSLDHIAYSLALAHTKPLPEVEARQCQLPIIGNEGNQGPAKFRKALRGPIKCISPGAQAVIDSVQPYKMGADFRDDLLWKLNYLSNTDKHRAIHVGAACVGSLDLNLAELLVDWTFAYNLRQVIKNSAVIATAKFIRAAIPDRQVEMNITPNMTIGFSDGPLADFPVVELLRDIWNYVAVHVISPLEKFL